MTFMYKMAAFLPNGPFLFEPLRLWRRLGSRRASDRPGARREHHVAVFSCGSLGWALAFDG
jgi:hypothetical protein